MKFAQIKIGQMFKWNQNTFVKCGASVAYCESDLNNGLPWLESFLDKMDVEVELVSKCENCVNYKPFINNWGFNCNQNIFKAEYASDAWMDVDPKSFSCSEFKERG